MEGIEACFSPGIGGIFGFEKNCIDLGMKIFLADKSVPKSLLTDNRFHITKKFVGIFSNEDYITMDDWVNSNIKNPSSDLLLQMDIESSEYPVISNMSDSLLKRFRILIIEFHDLKRLWDIENNIMIISVFEKILQNFTCVHIHPNNIAIIRKRAGIEIFPIGEFTFLRNDRINEKKPQTVFPNPLDFDNVKHRSHISLPKCWYDF